MINPFSFVEVRRNCLRSRVSLLLYHTRGASIRLTRFQTKAVDSYVNSPCSFGATPIDLGAHSQVGISIIVAPLSRACKPLLILPPALRLAPRV
jgi:hypothetical protein